MNEKLTETIRRRYNRIAPIFNWMDKMIKEEWRTELLSKAKGDVLEVGVGTGANLPYYKEVSSVTGIDFSPGMLRYAYKKAEQSNILIKLLEMDAQKMGFADNSFDTVVATCVYCSVPDPIAGLKEMRRVVKPDGRVLLLEHMRSENEMLGKVMDVLNPIPVRISGANINRRTLENIEKAGFTIEADEKLMGSIMRRLILHPNKS